MTSIARVIFLTAIWVLLWGDLSVANVVSGVVLSTVLLLAYPPPRDREVARRLTVRPIALVHLVGHIVFEMIVANVQISAQILSRRARPRSGFVVYEFANPASHLVTFVSSVLALSPGTIPVLVHVDPAFIAVHVLRLRDPDATRARIGRLEELASRAFAPATSASREAVAR